MEKRRIGNDFKHIWAINWNGLPEDFSDATEIVLTASVFGKKTILERGIDYVIEGNLIIVDFTPRFATIAGIYNLELKYIKPSDGFIDGERRSAVDIDVVQIVSKSSQVTATGDITSTSEAAFGFQGLSAYEVWLKDNPDKTKEDYYNWLQKPATDAVSLIDDKIEHLDEVIDSSTENEAERVTAEQGRRDAELLRNDAEGIRDSNEIDRIEAEGIRDANETDRINAESDRVDAEDLRKQAEAAREEAEGLRQTNTATAIQNAEDATTAANTAAGLANEATEAANTAAGLANNAAEAANTAAGLANNAATTANTAAQNADDARLAIQDDLALKANQADLAQLEDDVNLFKEESNLKDAIQDSKIKDIENVLSTANLNQSAQVSVSGVSPLSLPKNAANGGMSVKLEGLTEDVGGVITHFEPTGRVRSDIGGRNLFLNTSSLTSISCKGIVNQVGYLQFINKNRLGDNDVKLGDSITFSCQWKLETNGIEIPSSAYFYFRYQKTDNNWEDIPSYYYPYSIGTEGKIVVTRVVNANLIELKQNTVRVNYLPTGMVLKIWNIKLEKGNKATDWTPAPEDVLAGRVKGTGTSLYLTAPELRSNGTVKDEIRKGANGYELVKRISEVDGTVLTTPEIIPISYGGILNSAENGTVYHEPIIADAGVYDTKMDILLTDYPIATIEKIIKHENGVDTYLNVATAVIASDGLSFTHPDLASGDLVLFTYAYDKESTNGNITATFYDSNVVKIDTVTGKAYKIEDVVTNGVLTRTLIEV